MPEGFSAETFRGGWGQGRGGGAVGARGQVANFRGLLPPGLPSRSFLSFLPSDVLLLPDPVPGLPPYLLGSTLGPCFRDEVPGGSSECDKGPRDVRQS